MAYCTAKLQRNSDKTSPCLKPFTTGNMPDKCLLPGLSYRLHSDTFLLALPVSWGYQTQWEYYTRLPPNWIISFLEDYKELMHCFVLFPFFSSIWRMENIWSVVYLLLRNPHWWIPIISSAFGVNLESSKLENILYVADDSDMPL